MPEPKERKKNTPRLIVELPTSLVSRCEAAAKWMPTKTAKDLRDDVLALAQAAAATAAESRMLVLERIAEKVADTLGEGEKVDG